MKKCLIPLLCLFLLSACGKQPEVLTRSDSGSLGEMDLPKAGSILPEGPISSATHFS